MRSSEPPDVLDLERGLPTTAEDVAALRRARAATRLDLDAYLRFLEQFELQTEDAGKRRGPRGAPFTLSS